MWHSISNFIFGYADIKCITCEKNINVSKNHYGYKYNCPTACSNNCKNIYNIF
jgi:hypothetical protein